MDDPTRTDDPREILVAEGLPFLASGAADPARHLRVDRDREMLSVYDQPEDKPMDGG